MIWFNLESTYSIFQQDPTHYTDNMVAIIMAGFNNPTDRDRHTDTNNPYLQELFYQVKVVFENIRTDINT